MLTLIINSKNYTIQNEIVNLDKKNIEFDLTKNNDTFRIFLTRYFFGSSYMINHIFLYESNITIYNCYFALNQNVVSLKFDTAVIGLNSSCFDNEKTNQIFAKIDYKNFNMVDFEELSKKFKSFNINEYHYYLSINFSPRYCNLKIEYSRLINISTITKEFLNFFEYICFICGCNFELKKLYYNINEKEVCKILNLNSKFDTKKKTKNFNEIIIDNLDFKVSYLEWKNLRKTTHLIFDLYFNSIHSFHFTEVSLSLLLNCMEGYMKTVHMHDILDFLPNMKLDTILEKTYFSTSYSKKVMKLSERKKYDIFNNLQTHRNYFDHLDRVQPSFKGQKGNYILLKCELIFRLFVLNDLDISININKLKENIDNIEKRY